MQIYDCVEVIAIANDRFSAPYIFYQRHPRIGDRGTILECYTVPNVAYEVECSDASGCIIWLEAMYPDELTLVEQA